MKMSSTLKPLAACALAFSLSFMGVNQAAMAQDTAKASELSLITATPEEGFALAVALARKGVKTTQPDVAILKKERPEYASDAEDLIAASQVIAIHFQTVSAANNYWRK